MTNDDKMTLKQAMVFLGIKSPLTMRKYADTGVIPCNKVDTPSGPWRTFKKSDLAAFKAKMVKNPPRGMSYMPFGEASPPPKKRK